MWSSTSLDTTTPYTLDRFTALTSTSETCYRAYVRDPPHVHSVWTTLGRAAAGITAGIVRAKTPTNSASPIGSIRRCCRSSHFPPFHGVGSRGTTRHRGRGVPMVSRSALFQCAAPCGVISPTQSVEQAHTDVLGERRPPRDPRDMDGHPLNHIGE